MWRQLGRRHTQLHLLLLLLSCVVLLQISSLVTPYLRPGDASNGDLSRDSDAVSAGSGEASDAPAFRPVRRATSGTDRTVYVVTATYPRPEQEADLLRLAQTLMHAPFVFWVLVEDATRRTPAVTELLQRSGLRHVHLLGEPAPATAVSRQRFWGRVPRGVTNRNTGLAWLRRHASDGVAYFADDDNTYDIRLFTELLKTRCVSVFPVGLVTELGVSSPVVQDGRVVAFFDGWSGGRLFAIDMAGFAVSIDLLKQKPGAVMPYKAGYEEDGFLQALQVSPGQLEPLANNCTQSMRIKPRFCAAWLFLFILPVFHLYLSLPEVSTAKATENIATTETKIRQKLEESEQPDVPQWQLFTAGSLWDSSHRAPQQGRTGALHTDLQAAVEAAVDQLNSRLPASSGGQQPYTAADLLDGRFRHEPGRSSEYVLSFTSHQPGRLETVRLSRPAGLLSVAGSASLATRTVRVVVPYYHRPDVFAEFLGNVARLVLEGREPLQLVVVFYWKGTPAAEPFEVARDRDRVAALLQRLNRRAGRQVARLVEEKRAFSRGHALLRGAGSGGYDGNDVLLFFCDVDMFFDAAALRRCRSNAAPGRSVYYPIVFSTFNPALRALASGRPSPSLWKEHPVDPDVGFWRDFGYGMTCQFRSDFRRAAGDYLVSDSWGGEDVKLFKHHRLAGIEMVRAPDPGLVHVHHGSRCDRSQQQEKYSWCLGSQLRTEASAATWARWVQGLRDRQVRLSGNPEVHDSGNGQGQQPDLDNICGEYVMDVLKLIP